jgi:NADH-quinone oxidoreductase subunit N
MNTREVNTEREILTWRDLLILQKTNYPLAVIFGITFLSLAGIPPFAGFFGKYYVILSLIYDNIFLAIILLLISAVTAYYYLRVVKIMFFEENYLKTAFFQPVDKISGMLISGLVLFNLFIFLNPQILTYWYWLVRF